MQVAGAAAGDDGMAARSSQKPKRMTAYLLFQQATRADMYAKFGGKDAFTANLQERHTCQSSEVCMASSKYRLLLSHAEVVRSSIPFYVALLGTQLQQAVTANLSGVGFVCAVCLCPGRGPR